MDLFLRERMKMKTKGRFNSGTVRDKILAFLPVLFSSTLLFAQTAPVLEKFNADELNGKVLLSWTITAGGTCNGISVQRSLDSMFFTEIGTLEGVCGNLSFPTDYAFTDEAPQLNARNYYRLDLGGNGFSSVVSVSVIDLSQQDHALFPVPITDHAQVYFRNDGLLNATLTITDQNGKEILVLTEATKSFVLKREDLGHGGIYQFNITLEGNSNPVSGNFYVH